MKATMPTIPDYANITAATLNVRYYYNGTSNGTTIGLYRCIHDWDENTLTYLYTHFWTNYGLAATSTDSKTTPAGSIPANDPSILTFNILSLARQWYAGGTNHGIGLKYESGTNNCVTIHSYEANNTYKSYFVITYSNNSNPIVQNGTYFIRNKSTQQYIDDYHAIAEGESILQFEFTVDIGQRWIFRYAHWGNYYTIKTADSANDYFIGVDGDSTSANADIVFRQGLDSNGTRTMSDGMIWEITATSNGAYKLQAITGQSGSNDLVMRAAPYTGSSIDIAIKQIAYTNNTNYKDEWFIVTPHSSVELEAQHQTKWCWAASAIMSSKIFMLSPISQETAAVYAKYTVVAYTPTAEQIAQSNETNDLTGTKNILNFILGSSMAYCQWHKIYSESNLRAMIDANNPVIIARGWYSSNGDRNGGHDTIIYGYHWDTTYDMYVYDIYDPAPVGTGSSYYRSYQSICNGNSPAIPTDPNDNGIWEGIIVYKIGPYSNTIDWTGA